MKKALLTLTFLALSLAAVASADVTVTQKGRYLVVVGDQTVSEHNSYRKALESAINHNGTEATIQSPAYHIAKDMRDITLSWEPPVSRSDGTDLQPGEIESYGLYVTGPQKQERQYTVKASPLVVGVPPGYHQFAITAIDTQGLESDPSNLITLK